MYANNFDGTDPQSYLQMYRCGNEPKPSSQWQGENINRFCNEEYDALLDELAHRGAICYLASGTDEQFVIAEAKLLGLEPYFGDRIYGARDDYRSFFKKLLLERISAEHGVAGTALAVFGDGPVEITNARQVGGAGIGIASREDGIGGWDPWKRQRLVAAGAHMLVPDWRESARLLSFLCGESDD